MGNWYSPSSAHTADLIFNQEIRISMASLGSGLRVITPTHTSHPWIHLHLLSGKHELLLFPHVIVHHLLHLLSQKTTHLHRLAKGLRGGTWRLKNKEVKVQLFVCTRSVRACFAERWEGWRYYLFSFFLVLLHCCAFSTPGHYERFRMKGADECYKLTFILWGGIMHG